MRTPRVIVIAVLVLVLARPALGGDVAGTGADADLVRRIDAFLQTPALAGGAQGVYVESLSDGRVLYQRNADARFLPASNQKLLTTAAALHFLGKDYCYATTLLATGETDAEGTLHGDLVLRGSGYPFLVEADLARLVEDARKAGVKRVAGRVVGDGTRFDGVPYGRGWSWDDLSDDYAAPIGALNLNENVVTVKVRPGSAAGDPVSARIVPEGSGLTLSVQATTIATGGAHTIGVARELGSNRIVVTGALPADTRPANYPSLVVTVDDPARYAAGVFAERLRAAGIAVDGEAVSGAAPAGAREIARLTSPPLAQIVRRTNKPSDNLAAECLLKTLAAEKQPDAPGSSFAGARLVMDWLATLGAPAGSVSMSDGSGLSRVDFVAPRGLAALLRGLPKEPCWRALDDSLPIAGRDGTLANRMKGTAAAGNCRAKTGSMTAVSSLSGYVKTADGEPLLFVIFMNNHDGPASAARAAQDQIVVLLAGWKRAGHGQ